MVKESLIYSLAGDSSDTTALRVLNAMGDVMAWYEDSFGYRGVDGNGGAAMLVLGVSKERLGSIAANLCDTGHVFLLAESEHGETAADAPEILAHEMGHALLKNMVHLGRHNDSAALHEAISDVLACLYDPTKDWHVANGLQDVRGKDLCNYNFTMKDYRYNYHYTGETMFEQPEYIGDSKILVFIRKTALDLRNDYGSTLGKYHNAKIVGGVMYRVWDEVFDRDSELMGEVLMDSLHYLPSNANFSQFRDAFMYSTGKLMGRESMRRVGLQFDVAGIYYNAENYVAFRGADTPSYLVDTLQMTYGQVRMLEWDSCDVAETDQNWYCLCEKAGVTLNWTYAGQSVQDPTALPMRVRLNDYAETLHPVPIAAGITLGMTYGAIAEKVSLSPSANGTSGKSVAVVALQDYTLELTFRGSGSEAVLISACVSKNG